MSKCQSVILWCTLAMRLWCISDIQMLIFINSFQPLINWFTWFSSATNYLKRTATTLKHYLLKSLNLYKTLDHDWPLLVFVSIRAWRQTVSLNFWNDFCTTCWNLSPQLVCVSFMAQHTLGANAATFWSHILHVNIHVCIFVCFQLTFSFKKDVMNFKHIRFLEAWFLNGTRLPL